MKDFNTMIRHFITLLAPIFLLQPTMAGDVPIFNASDYPRDAFQIEATSTGHLVKIAGQKDPQMAPHHFVIRTADGYLMVDNFRDGRQAQSFIHATSDSPAAYLVGHLGVTFPYAINALQTDYPWVKILILKEVPGGYGMEAIIDGMHMIYDAGMATVLEPDSMVASAGTDVFIAGKYRHAMAGAKLGIHEFGGDAPQGEDKTTTAIRDFFTKVGIRDDFYAFMRSKPHDTMYWLNPTELKKYNITNATLADIEKITGANASKN